MSPYTQALDSNSSIKTQSLDLTCISSFNNEFMNMAQEWVLYAEDKRLDTFDLCS